MKHGINQKDSNYNRVVLVTGATGAIGKAIARQLAAKEDTAVVVLGRNEEKARRTVDEIGRATGNQNVRYEVVDLSSRASIESLAARWRGSLHVLINNAAVTPRSRQETSAGIELQFATNVLGYFWLTQAFGEHLNQSAPARVINVASYWAGGLDMADLEFRRRRYSNNAAYRQSKQANRMLTAVFAERFKLYQVTVNACHPGDVNSTLSNNLGFGGHETPDEGARTPVWLATDETGAQETGKYFEHMRAVYCPFMANKREAEELYAACLRF